MIKAYYNLTKPGIIYGNALTAIGAFLLAARWHIDWGLLAAMVAGLSLVIASGCVFNNYLDRHIDAKMARTRKRALVSGTISPRNALLYATMLGLAGFLTLSLATAADTAWVALAAFVSYVIFYGLAKRRSVHGTLVGSLPGAAPPVIGYTAVIGHLDTTALLLFLILICWQMPHFYAIAIYRLRDYKAAGIPVLPAVKGNRITKIQILGYICAFIVAAALLSLLGPAGYSFAVVMSVIGLVWLYRGLKGFQAADETAWARSMFGFSLIVLLSLSAMLSLATVLP